MRGEEGVAQVFESERPRSLRLLCGEILRKDSPLFLSERSERSREKPNVADVERLHGGTLNLTPQLAAAVTTMGEKMNTGWRE